MPGTCRVPLCFSLFPSLFSNLKRRITLISVYLKSIIFRQMYIHPCGLASLLRLLLKLIANRLQKLHNFCGFLASLFSMDHQRNPVWPLFIYNRWIVVHHRLYDFELTQHGRRK